MRYFSSGVAIITLIVTFMSLQTSIDAINKTMILSNLSNLTSMILNDNVDDKVIELMPELQKSCNDMKGDNDVHLYQTMALVKYRLESGHISYVDISGIMIMSNLLPIKIKNAELREVKLTKAIIKNCELWNWKLGEANMDYALMENVHYDYGQLYNIGANHMKVSDVKILHVPFRNVFINNSNFYKVLFRVMVISESEFRDCTFKECQFIRCHITSDFKSSNFISCKFEDTMIRNYFYGGTKFKDNEMIRTVFVNNKYDDDTRFINCKMDGYSYFDGLIINNNHPDIDFIKKHYKK
jgi:uncharacterized protein YjbI with pentapeptide repeats